MKRRYYDTDTNTIRYAAIVRDALILLTLATVAVMAGCPYYNVWQQGQRGKAELQRAEQNRRITVLEAEAKLEAAKSHARAEVERARGVAEANRIVADGLKGKEEYLRYLWIREVAGGNVGREVVYIPTEAQLPILEARPRQ